MELAHIIVFAFNRPHHFKRTIESLSLNQLASESSLTVFCDGARNNSDISAVSEVRNFANTITGFKSVEIVEQTENKGLSQSIIEGVTKTLEKYNSVIVLEDDLVSSPQFLTYMNNSLKMYESSLNVISIHGYCYPVHHTLPDSFFIKGADCWGWATWKRGWKNFEPDGIKLLNELKEKRLCKEFDFNNSHPYTRMLKNQISGKIQSWAIRWYASAFLKEMLTLYPGKSLIQNIGNDFSGTNSWESDRYYVEFPQKNIEFSFVEPLENIEAKNAFADFFLATKKSVFSKIISRLKFVIKKRRNKK